MVMLMMMEEKKKWKMKKNKYANESFSNNLSTLETK